MNTQARYLVWVAIGLSLSIALFFIALRLNDALGLLGLSPDGQGLSDRLAGDSVNTPHVPAALGPEGQGPITSRPAYSPDGREIAFWTLWRGGQPDIWVVSSAGGSLRPLAADPFTSESWPAWSPDGSWIAFKSDRGGAPNIWLVRPDGSGLTQVTSGNAIDDQPTWSPDGTQVAFVSNRAGVRNVWVVNVDGSGLRRVTQLPCCQNHPSFSPDGRQIVFARSSYVRTGAGSQYAGSHLWVINVNGTGLRQLTSGSFEDTSPSWGEGGILFSSNRPGPGAGWLIQPDRSGLQAIPNGSGLNPIWSPDGNRFAVGRGDGIYEFDRLSGLVRPVVELRGYFIAIDIVPGVHPNVIRLRPDPREIAPIRVAILSTPDFQPLQRVNQSTISFGRSGDERSMSFCTADEVNGDGIPDLICHFETQTTGFRAGDSQGILRFLTLDRIWFEGRDSVRIE